MQGTNVPGSHPSGLGTLPLARLLRENECEERIRLGQRRDAATLLPSAVRSPLVASISPRCLSSSPHQPCPPSPRLCYPCSSTGRYLATPVAWGELSHSHSSTSPGTGQRAQPSLLPPPAAPSPPCSPTWLPLLIRRQRRRTPRLGRGTRNCIATTCCYQRAFPRSSHPRGGTSSASASGSALGPPRAGARPPSWPLPWRSAPSCSATAPPSTTATG